MYASSVRRKKKSVASLWIHALIRQCRLEPSQTSIFPDFTFLHILKAYVRIYQLAKFRVLILLNLWIIADSNSVRTVLSPLEKHRSVINHAPRACAQVVSASCSHRRAYKSNTVNAYRIVINQSRSSICGGFTLRALGNNASNRHKGIRIRVLNVLAH